MSAAGGPLDGERRVASRPAALAIVGAAMVAAATLLLYWGRGGTIGGDDLEYAVRLAQQPFGHALLHTPPGKYLIPVPLTLYKGMFETFGLSSYLPYRAVAVALVLLCGGLFFALARRRVGDLPAVAPTVLVLFFGSAGSVLLTGMRIPGLIALATGLGALLALDGRTRRGDLAATGLLLVSIASHPSGAAFIAAAAVLVLLRPSPERWRRVWVFLAPIALFGAWWLLWRAPSPPSPFPTRVSSVYLFMRDSWTTLTASVSGLSGVLQQPVFDQPPAQLAAALLFALLLAGIAWRFRQLPPSFWAALAGLLVLLAATRLAPAGYLRTPDSARYLYPEAFLFLLVLIELAGAMRPPRWVAWAATAVLLLGLWWNLDQLNAAGRTLRETSEGANGYRAGYEIAGPKLRPNYRSSSFGPTAGGYLDAVAAYGSPAISPSALATAPPRTRISADTALVGSLGIRFRAPRRGAAPRGRAPRLESVSAARAVRRRGCLELRPRGGAIGSAELLVPRGGIRASSGDLPAARVLLGRFADSPTVPVEPLDDRTTAWLRIPSDDSTAPWRVMIQSTKPVSVCGLRGRR